MWVNNVDDEVQSRRTYLSKGRRVIAQIIALIPPMISSWDGKGPVLGQIPFRTYRGEVPMSE
jgi:hypothetical protein